MTYRAILIPGDGIGPEVTRAAQRVLDSTGVAIDWEILHVGEAALAGGADDPVPRAALDAIRETEVALKGPITTRAGGSHRSANLTLRQELDLYVQVRPVRSFVGVDTAFSDVDVVVMRETTEDLYAGIEFAAGSEAADDLRAWIHEHGFDVAAGSGISIKAISARAFARALSFALGWARANGRQRVTIVHKATVMRATDGILLEVAGRLAEASADLEIDNCSVDSCAMQLARRPADFDVLVTTNLYGDILSDLAAALVGGVGVVPGGNYGEHSAIFEAAHGTAPKYTGMDRANPIAVILSGALMLDHLGEGDAARRVEHAVAATLAEGLRPRDLGGTLGTRGLTEAIVSRLR